MPGSVLPLVRFSALILNHALTGGVSYSFGVFYIPLLSSFQSSSAATVAWIGSLNIAILCFVCPFASHVIDRRGCAIGLLTGGLLSSAGLITTCFAPNIYVLFLTFGILTGAGYGIATITSVVAVYRYFRRHLAVVQGVALAGASVGSLLAPLVCRYSMDTYGWRGTMLLLGALTLHVCVGAPLFRKDDEISKEEDPSLGTTTDQMSKQKNLRQTEPRQRLGLFCQINFVILCANALFLASGFNILYTYLGALVEDKGFGSHVAALVLSSLGLANLLGRVLLGITANFECVDVILLFGISFLLAGTAAFLLPVWNNLFGIFVLSVIPGIFCAAMGSVLTELIRLVFGVHNLSFVYACHMASQALGFLAGGPTAGWMYQRTGRYLHVYLLSGSALLLSGLLGLLLKVLTRCRQPQSYQAVDLSGQIVKDVGIAHTSGETA